jgi:hypothetical protein
MQDEYDPISNNINVSVPFMYPEETTTQELVEQLCSSKMNDLLNKLAIYVLPAKDPRLTLIALFFAAGVDLEYILNCENTEIALAKKLGIPKQTMSLVVKQVRQDFNLEHSSTKMHGKTAEKYENNYRRPANDTKRI